MLQESAKKSNVHIPAPAADLNDTIDGGTHTDSSVVSLLPPKNGISSAVFAERFLYIGESAGNTIIFRNYRGL